MQRRKLGGLEVGAVGLGCATMTPFYDAPDHNGAIATIRRARELGVDFLDSSDAYGAGRNEELIAEAVAGNRHDYVIASKFGNVQLQGGPRFADGRPEYVKECCDKSLARLARRRMPRFQGDNLQRNLQLVEELKAHAAAENCMPAQLCLAWLLSRGDFIVPIAGTSHIRYLEQNAAAAGIKLAADTEDALKHVFAPGAASGTRYPEAHLVRLGI